MLQGLLLAPHTQPEAAGLILRGVERISCRAGQRPLLNPTI
jgi:hypothetical protein